MVSILPDIGNCVYEGELEQNVWEYGVVHYFKV